MHHRCSEAGNLIEEEIFALTSFIQAEPAVEGSQGSTTNRSEKLDRLNLRSVWRVRQMQWQKPLESSGSKSGGRS
jgi:hypothetical protein